MDATASRAAKATTPTSARPPSIRNSPRIAAGRRLQPRSTGKRRSTGFTLVEILVVVVIMAIVIAFAVLSIGVSGRDAQLDDESRRIEGLITMLHDRALLEGRDFGLRLEPSAYEFVVYDPRQDRWRLLDQEREFRHRELPRGIAFRLELDSRQVVLKPIDRNLAADESPPGPQVAIAASGEATPFRLSLLREGTNTQSSVSGDALGRTTRVASDQPAKRPS